MSETMQTQDEAGGVKGRFVWFDVMTTDVAGAEAFYCKVVGWTAKDSGMPGQTYMLFSSGEDTVAGLMPVPEEDKGAHPVWMGYIGVDDVDVYADKMKAAGGAVHKAPWDIPGVGRMSVVADPQGVYLCLFTPAESYQGGSVTSMRKPGRIGWCELHAQDGDKALEFYTGMFGWRKADEVDMGPAGKYHIFDAGHENGGGIMTKMAGAPGPPMWLYYFNVDALDAAVQRIDEGGGKVMMGPHQVPGGTWIVVATDPQGAMFALAAQAR